MTWLPCLLLLATLGSDNWPQFRGPGGQGHSNATRLPATWSETKNVAWKVPLPGRGWSSPVVVGDQVWVTTACETPATDEETKRRLAGNPRADFMQLATHVSLHAVCVERRSGKLSWDVGLFDVDEPGPIESVNSYASPTPVAEPGRVYCDFGAFGTACVDTAKGKLAWKRRVPVDHQVGPGSSPVLYRDLLILVRDGADLQYITALDKASGDTVWKTNRPPFAPKGDYMRKAFSTPLLIDADGRKQMIVPGAEWCVSYNPASGEPIWQVNYGSGHNVVPRPVFGHGMVYVCTGYAVPQLWAVRADGRGDVTDTHVVWKARRQIPTMSSPLLVGNEIYVVSENGIATCFDARTGRTRWCQRLGGNYSASPLFADERIYFFSQQGQATAVQSGTVLVPLAVNRIDGRIMASPAIADSAFFVRSETHLYRIEKR